jgi:hypothetical protein
MSLGEVLDRARDLSLSNTTTISRTMRAAGRIVRTIDDQGSLANPSTHTTSSAHCALLQAHQFVSNSRAEYTDAVDDALERGSCVRLPALSPEPHGCSYNCNHPARLTLRRVPSWMSVATATDSTTSTVAGAGATMDRLLTASGRSLDAALVGAGKALGLGLGPSALVLRFLDAQALDAMVYFCTRCYAERMSSSPSASFAEVTARLLHWPCARCFSALRAGLFDSVLSWHAPAQAAFDAMCARLIAALR